MRKRTRCERGPAAWRAFPARLRVPLRLRRSEAPDKATLAPKPRRPPVGLRCSSPTPLAVCGFVVVGDLHGTPDGAFERRGQVAHICVGSSWGVTLGIVGLDLCFPPVALNWLSASIWCNAVRDCVGARGKSTRPGGDYLRGALIWETCTNLRTSSNARLRKHTQAQATQPLHHGPPTPILTAF